MKTKRHAVRAAAMETLEARTLMSAVSFQGGVLSLTGDANSPNKIVVSLRPRKGEVVARVNRTVQILALAGLTEIDVAGGGRNNTIKIDPRLKVPAIIHTGAG